MRRFYPWWIAFLACIALLISNGMTISGISVYDESLQNLFGWDRGALKFRDMVTFAVVGLAAPFAGVLIDRFGVRACMLFGWLLLAAAYYLYSRIGSILELYSVHAVFGIVLVLCGLNAAVILVSHWFRAKRGTAIGIALVGTSLGGVLMPQYGTYMITTYGWREALLFGGVIPLVMFVITALCIRNKPADIGLQPFGGDGAGKNTAPEAEQQPQLGLSYGEALRTRSFWALAVIAMTTFYTVLGAQSHLFLYMRDLNFTPQAATNAISMFFFCALVGKFIFGFVADYLDSKKVFYGNILVMLVGAVCLAAMNPALITIAVILFGLGWGGVYTMIQLSAVNSFGLQSAGKILGTITVLDALGGGLGIWLTGVFYERFGSYNVAFVIFLGLIMVAMVCISQVRPVNSRSAPSPLAAPN